MYNLTELGHTDPARIVNYAVGWFLKDATTRELIRSMWFREIRSFDGTVLRVEPLSPEMHPNGVEWKKIMVAIRFKFRRRIENVVGYADDAKWTSYGLSYMALRACANLGRYKHHAYIYKACVNAHKRFLKRAESWGSEQRKRRVKITEFAEGFDPAVRCDTDLRLDFEEALCRLPSEDAKICRWYVLDNYTFEEIGRKLDGMHRSTVKRRYDRSIATVKVILADYCEVGHTQSQPASSVAA